MKKVISLILALAICLSLCACGKSDGCSCDCAQCADCEKKIQTTEAADTNPVDIVPETTEQNNDVIRFETPIVVAEDQYLRVELVKFYQEPRLWKNGYPYAADSTTEGATLEKFVTFRFCSKTDHALYVRLDDIYLGSDSAVLFNRGSSEDVAAGKNVLVDYLIRTGEKETLKTVEELYSLDGNFYIFHKTEDNVLRNGYSLKFSIPNGMNSSNADPVSDNSEAWNQFRNYLKEHGPVTILKNDDDPPKWHYQETFTIEENAGTIQISRIGDGTMVSGTLHYHGLYTTQFELPANVNTITVKEGFVEDGTDENGNRREESGSTEYIWDIQNYHHGDKITFPMDYSELDTSGNYVQKTGTMTATDAYSKIADTLSQTLAESGLDITMADLGFTSY